MSLGDRGDDMPPLNLLIKPASGACNIRCDYCFYRDETLNRETAFAGMLSLEKTEILIREAIDVATGSCSFFFQGGEPTLAGLEYFKSVIKTEEKYTRAGVKIYNSIQTNGCLIDDAWAQFFAENRFLVGLSLDGFSELHNASRTDAAGKGTFSAVMNAVRLFEKYSVEYNILCVVSGKTARCTEKLMHFYLRNRLYYLQFIPCLPPLGGEQPGKDPVLSQDDYYSFLVKSFDIWYARLLKGEYFSIRHIDNWISILLGRPPESCGMCGRCAIQYVIEGDGGIYPCDFYVLDEWRLGAVGETPLLTAGQSEKARLFIDGSLDVPDVCRGCRFYPLCRNGCRRERNVKSGVNRFCTAYSEFFTEREAELCRAASIIQKMR